MACVRCAGFHDLPDLDPCPSVGILVGEEDADDGDDHDSNADVTIHKAFNAPPGKNIFFNPPFPRASIFEGKRSAEEFFTTNLHTQLKRCDVIQGGLERLDGTHRTRCAVNPGWLQCKAV